MWLLALVPIVNMLPEVVSVIAEPCLGGVGVHCALMGG